MQLESTKNNIVLISCQWKLAYVGSFLINLPPLTPSFHMRGISYWSTQEQFLVCFLNSEEEERRSPWKNDLIAALNIDVQFPNCMDREGWRMCGS